MRKPLRRFLKNDLTGWSFANLENRPLAKTAALSTRGILAVIGKPTGYLVFAGTYSNYRLPFECGWIEPSGNSGIFVHLIGGPMEDHPFEIRVRRLTPL